MPVTLFLLSLALGGSGSEVIHLTPLPKAELEGGCGCFFRTGDGSGQVVFAQDSDQNEASVGINGKVVRTTLESKDDKPKRTQGESVGDRFHQVQRLDDLRVTLDYETTWVCPENDEGCEVTRYRGTLTVIRGKQSRSFKVVGECGC